MHNQYRKTIGVWAEPHSSINIVLSLTLGTNAINSSCNSTKQIPQPGQQDNMKVMKKEEELANDTVL